MSLQSQQLRSARSGRAMHCCEIEQPDVQEPEVGSEVKSWDCAEQGPWQALEAQQRPQAQAAPTNPNGASDVNPTDNK